MRVDSAHISLFDSLRTTIAERALANLEPKVTSVQSWHARSTTTAQGEPVVSVPSERLVALKPIEAMLEHLVNFLITGDLRMHRDFLQALLAMRNTHTQTASSVMSSLAELGDTAARVVQADGDTETHRHLIQQLVGATAITIRICNELVAKDLERKIAQRDQLRQRQSGVE